MFIDHHGARCRIAIADTTDDPDDPRGRSFGVNVDAGVPTGEFDTATRHGPARTGGYTEVKTYGSWGVWAVLWRWSLTVVFRGPIIGHYPPDADEPECGALHPEGDGPCIMLAGHVEQGSHAAEHHTGTGKAWT